MRPSNLCPPKRRGSGLPIIVIVAGVGPLACGPANDGAGSDGAVAACSANTDAIQTQILQPVCGASGCHGGAQPALSLDLVSPGLEHRIIDAPSNGCADKVIVVPGDPASSYLLAKLTQDSPPCGERMPLVGTRLTAAQISCLETWISKLVPPPANIDGGSDAAGDAPSAAGDGGTDAGLACPAGQAACGTSCVDIESSNTNCGVCGRSCTAGTSCVSGQCVCQAGLTLCGSTCVDTGTSSGNCGACGKTCGIGQTCSAGVCTCQSGLTNCSGTCVDLSSSNNNCGACGHTCSGGVCSGGRCASSCPTGTTNCSGSCVSLSSSSTNCGSCGYTCAAGLSCVNGSCACPAGQTLCGSTCVSGSSDPSNCGACGHVCPGGTTCSAGSCVCPSGQTLCGSTCVNTATDNSNCGTCGKVCSSGQVCAAGVCGCGPIVSFSNQVQPIFTANCASAGCHTGARPAASLSLASGYAYTSLVYVPTSTCTGLIRVTPSAVPQSYLMNKLLGINICSGTQMPKTGGALSSSDINTISSWICEGAPKN